MHKGKKTEQRQHSNWVDKTQDGKETVDSEVHIYKSSENWNKRMTTITEELYHINPAEHSNQ